MADSLSGLVKPRIVILPVVDPHLHQSLQDQIIDLVPTQPRELLQRPDRIRKQGIVVVQLGELIVPPTQLPLLLWPTPLTRK